MGKHPALLAAERAIALAPAAEKFRVIGREALRLHEAVASGDVHKTAAIDALCFAGRNNGLDDRNVEHVVRAGLDGIVSLAPASAGTRKVIAGITTAKTLQRMTFAPMKFVVQGILAEGLTLLAGAPKIGKSWLSLDMAVAVAAGRCCLGDRGVEQGDVLYLGLEDGERRLQQRFAKLLPAGDEWPSSFEYATEWSRGDQGISKIDEWCAARPRARMVVVDVFEKFRPLSNDRNVYGRDYADLAPLQRLAARCSIAVLVVHHTRKGGADAAVEKISGTLALPGAADAWMVLDRGASGATLTGTGRDVEDLELAVEFDRGSCRWRILGSAAEFRRTTERARVIDFLAGEANGASPSDVAAELGLSPVNAKQLLSRMARNGEVVRVSRGLYFHTDIVACGTSVTLSPSRKSAVGAGFSAEGDKVTEVTPPDWTLPLVRSVDGGGGGAG